VSKVKLWTKPVSIECEDLTHWAKLRAKTDVSTDETYFDVLVGLRSKTPHAHYGINLNQTFRFQEFRKTTHSVWRNVVSEQHGLVEDKTIIVDDTIKGGKKLSLRVTIDGPTGEVSVDEFKIR
jgi:hypothetical protein